MIGDPLSWSLASGSPVCVTLRFLGHAFAWSTASLFTRLARFSLNGHLYAGHAFSWPLAGFAPSPRMFVH